MSIYTNRTDSLQQRMQADNVDAIIFTDDDSIYYFCGYYDFLHMEFGRPTLLVIDKEGSKLLITPTIDYNSATDLAEVDRIEAWNDGMGEEWREHLPAALSMCSIVGVESAKVPPLVTAYLNELSGLRSWQDITPIIDAMRMIKSDEELMLARHAGEVATAMMQAGRNAIQHGVPEYEVALATSRAGTLKAAEILRNHYPQSVMSPNTHFLQIMASGSEITRTHHRASNRIMQRGEPVFLCFCGMTNFHRFKLGFDRTFWIGEIADKSQAAVYEVAVASQQAALNALRPGVTAESVHAAYAKVIQGAGYDYPFRCGRATGFSFLEKPQLVTGDTTILQPGMVLAIDGSVAVDTFRAQVGDSFIITEDGYEGVTDHPKSLKEVII